MVHQHLGGRGHWIFEFNASLLVYRASSKIAKARQGNPDLKNKQEKKKRMCKYINKLMKPDILGHAFNPSTQEAETGAFL